MPLQDPDAVQDDALVEDQVRVNSEFASTTLSDADKVTVGDVGGGVVPPPPASAPPPPPPPPPPHEAMINNKLNK